MAGAPGTQRKVRGRPSTKSGYVARRQPPSQANTFHWKTNAQAAQRPAKRHWTGELRGCRSENFAREEARWWAELRRTEGAPAAPSIHAAPGQLGREGRGWYPRTQLEEELDPAAR
eukprot:scaffold2420_cov85-Phaeocystis_antarctica.AAC.2